MIRNHLATEGQTFFCHNVAVKIRGLTLREIVDILCDPVFQETRFVIQGHVDVACPAEFDTSTDEEEDPNNVTGTVEIQSVLGKFEIQHSSIKAYGNRVTVTHSLRCLLTL